jgi:hypothetical protein
VTILDAFTGNLIAVDSSVIRAVGYDGSTLTVEFHSGRVYDHPNVPYHLYIGLMQADSKGAYYNRHIRGKYR